MNNSLEEKNYIENQVQLHGKNKVIAWLLWLFLAGLGAHRFYLGRTGSAVTMLLLFFFVSPWMLYLPTAIWVIVDAFLINGIVNTKNDNIRKEAQRELRFKGL